MKMGSSGDCGWVRDTIERILLVVTLLSFGGFRVDGWLVVLDVLLSSQMVPVIYIVRVRQFRVEWGVCLPKDSTEL